MVDALRIFIGLVLGIGAAAWSIALGLVFFMGVFIDYSWVPWTLSQVHPLVQIVALGGGLSAMVWDLAKKIAPKS
jgi:hypothetical protein